MAYVLVIWGQHDWFVGELGVKVFEVSLRADLGFVRRVDLSSVQQLPVNDSEERVRLNVCESSLWVAAQSLLGTLHEQQFVQLTCDCI